MQKRTNYLLVIGIDKYQSPSWENLDNPVHDTLAFVDVLTIRYGFELIQPPLFNEQATRANIIQASTNIIPILGNEDNLIIYFGGHVFMHPLTQKGFWVPVEAGQNAADFISNSDVKDFLENIPAKHIFLMADACFTGTFLTRTRGNAFERSYASLDAKKSRWMLASGGEETVSDGIAGKGSPFCRYLLKLLNINSNKYLSVLEIIRYVTTLTSHHSRQQPKGAQIENIGHDGGEMVLILKEDFIETNILRSNNQPRTEALAKEMQSVYKRRSKIPAGKEIILVDSFFKPGELHIWELFRFDDNGDKRFPFLGDKVKMPAKDDPNFELKLIRRFSTWESLSKYLEENKDEIGDRRVTVLNASEEINKIEETPAAIHHQGLMQDMLDNNEDIMRCLHCNEMITNNNSYLVELDELGIRDAIGNVHSECLRPADRILGKTIFENPDDSNLINFDVKKWIDLLRKGQGFLTSAKKHTSEERVATISWNKEHNFNTGDFCISMTLDDGSSQYVRLGKDIHRFHSDEIDEEIEEFNKSLKTAEEKGDPIGFTSRRKTFGSFSKLSAIKEPDESLLRIIRHEKAKYSKQIDSLDDSVENDYTPLGILTDPQSKGFISFGQLIPIVSDTSKFETLHKSWNETGYHVGKCTLTIIENDKELDLFLTTFFSDGIQPVIDPLFDNNKRLVEGLYIKNFADLKDQSREFSFQTNPDGKWKAGDRVKVVFPKVKTDKHARGILLADEFYDETGESCALFQAIENGAIRPDLVFKMPTKLFVKDN